MSFVPQGLCAMLLLTLAGTLQASPTSPSPSTLIDTLAKCDATYFDALAKVPAVAPYLTSATAPGARRYVKIENVPLEEITFKTPVKIQGITVTGLIFHDQIVHYEGMPEMHQHVWGLLVKDGWDVVIANLKLPWEVVDTTHRDASLPWVKRMKGTHTWVTFRRDHERQVPDLGVTEKTFHAIRYKEGSALVCMMMSAGRPDDELIEATRPDLFHAEKAPFVYEPDDDAVRHPELNNPHRGM